MALSARQELYEILNHWTVTAAGRDASAPLWGDDVTGDTERNAIGDAEMLLSFLTPTFVIDAFSLANIDRVPDRGLANALEQLSKRDAGTAERGFPVPGSSLKNFLEPRIRQFVTMPLDKAFAPGTYVTRSDGDEDDSIGAASLRVVDAYTLTISVCVQAMYLLTSWINHEENAASPEVDRLGSAVRDGLVDTRNLCSDRLTKALLGLIRSFTVVSYDDWVGPGAPGGGYESSRLWEQKNARAWPNGLEFGWSSDTLATVRRRLGARPEYNALLRGDHIPFACGFAWGPTSDEFWGDDQMPEAQEEHPTFADGATPVWATDAPYLYFTITAIEGVADLLATKVRSANILTRDQSYLAAQLGFLVENTTMYWRALAFAPRTKRGDEGEGWYLELLPWRTADGDRDDYYSLYVVGLILGAREQTLNAAQLGRIIMLLEELAQRARITRAPYVFGDEDASDPALRIHYPGKPLTLAYADEVSDLPGYIWRVDDFAPKLLKLAGVAAQRAEDPALRRRALKLADEIWEKNLKHRAFRKYVRGSVWDAPLRPYAITPELWVGHNPEEDGEQSAAGLDPDGLEERYSWHMTQRVSEALVAVTRGQERSTTTGDQMRVITEEILDSLAERGSALDGYRAQLSEAEERLRAEQPSRALQEALVVLGEVEARNGSHSDNGAIVS
jgi:hypothetical protein